MSERNTHRTVKTVWELRTYDVWGNADDGYEVNDSSVYDRNYVIDCEVIEYNFCQDSAFLGAYPTDAQIREAFGIDEKTEIECDGDDTVIYVNRAADSYPLGELSCTSHESLSPIREIAPELKH